MAKVIFAWPPLNKPKGYVSVGQNRNFYWHKDPHFTYPMNAAQCATMLLKTGNEMLWVDSISDELTDVDFGRIVIQMNPDFMVFEAQTPLVRRYWEIINGFKQHMPNIKIILCGDHVTGLFDESESNCGADIVIRNKLWQFDAFKAITGKDWPKTAAMPHIDRNATRWWLYGYKNDNYKYLPGTYIMADLGYGVRPVEDVLDEIEDLINMGFKEIFDDSSAFPCGDWLIKFCQGAIDRGYNDYVAFGCNMAFGVLRPDDFKLMAKAGFRILRWNLRSVNQITHNQLNTGIMVNQVSEGIILAKAAGIQNHISVTFGYPWETYGDARRTYDMAKYWLRNGWAWSVEPLIFIPYPGTFAYQYCVDTNNLLSQEWIEYDMTKPVAKALYPDKELFKFHAGIDLAHYDPRCIWHKLRTVRCAEDLKYGLRMARKLYDRAGNFYTIEKVPTAEG